MSSSNTFAQFVSSVTDYNRRIATAHKTLETISISFSEGMKPGLQKLNQYLLELQIAQKSSAEASMSESHLFQAHVDTAKQQVDEVQRAIFGQKASYKICKKEQEDNIERWGIEVEKINQQLSMLQDF